MNLQMEQPVLEFDNIKERKIEELKALRILLESQGWAFVKMPKETTALVPPAIGHLESLFQNPPEKIYSFGWGGRSQPLGLLDTPYKLSFTCPTGTELEKSIERGLPGDINGLHTDTRALAAKLDSNLLQIVEATSVDYFGLTAEELGKKLDISMLDTFDASKDDESHHPKAAFALFDAAFYKNGTRTGNDLNRAVLRRYHKSMRAQKNTKFDISETSASSGEGANCAEHYDPGLYTLWVGETQSGLKLRDATGDFVPPHPDDAVFVLWVGKAAKVANAKFVPALHRVDAPVPEDCDGPVPPRLSLWSELCTRNQVAPDKYASFVSADAIEVRNAVGRKNETKLRVRVKGGNLDEALATVSSILRMPMSKTVLVPLFDKDGFVEGVEPFRVRAPRMVQKTMSL